VEAVISLENKKVLFQLNSSPAQLIIYQLKYFGLNNLNDDGKNFEGNIETTKLVAILNYLEKKQIKANLDSGIIAFLEDLKNKEVEKKRKKDFLISLKQNPDKEDYDSFLKSVEKLYLKRKLEPHQLKSLHHLYNCSSAAVFSVPGSGKTSVVLAYYEKLKLEGKVDHIFIVGPVNSFVSWVKEFSLNINRKLNSIILGSNIKKEDRKIFYSQKLNCEMIMAHFSTIANDVILLKKFFEYNKVLLVIDEAHNIKKIDGRWSNAVLSLGEKVNYKVVLTGTPLPNDLRDIYNYLDFLFGENFVFNKKDKARIENLLNQEKKIEAIDLVREKINPFYTRVTKKELNLSTPNFNKPIMVEMNPIEKKIYDAIQSKISHYGRESFLDNIEFVQKICRARIIRLKQAASYVKNLETAIDEDFLNEDEKILRDNDIKGLIASYDKLEKPAKLLKLISMVKDFKKKNKKVLIWSTHLKTIDLILENLRLENIVVKKITGEINRDFEIKKNIMEEFNDNNSDLDALVALPQACSESISLHKACQNAIYYDLNYNAAEFLQSLDRIHRVGGSEIHPVYYNFLHYEKTVDTKIFERVFLKADRQMQIIEEDNLTFDLSDDEEDWEHLYNDLNL
jgi:SNF2 family DNA or RNA helicase